MAYTDYLDTVQELYIAYYQRPADPEGLVYWAKRMDTGGAEGMIDAFANSPEATALYGTITSSNIGGVIDSIYTALFHRPADAEGKAYYTENFNNGTFTAGTLCLNILNGATDTALYKDLTTSNNKLAAANLFTKTIDPELDGQNLLASYVGPTIPLDDPEYQAGRDFLTPVTSALSTVPTQSETTNYIQANIADPGDVLYPASFTLTNGTDEATANIFYSGLVYNPAGTDRINALQSEDTLIGAGTDATLNATLGNANDNGAKSITPTLENIETINLDITGDTNTLDVRFADSLKNISINKLTAEAADKININNIGQPAANLTVQDSALVDNTVNFNYVDGVLAGTAGNPGSLTLSKVQAAVVHVGNEKGATDTEGFENLTLTSTNTNVVKSLEAIDLENLTIKGSGSLSLLQTAQAAENIAFTAGQGVAIGDGIGIRTIDASGFSGTLNVDVTNAVGKHTDPANSGAPYYAVITGGTGDDTFWTGKNITAESATLLDTIDGGTGNNTIRTYASIVPTGATNQFNAKITNVQTLEMRQAGVVQVADLDAFDTNLTKVLMRDEDSTNGFETFTLNSVTKAIAEGGNIILRHAADSTTLVDSGDTWGGTVNINLKDASGASDTVVVKIENDLNQETKFDYTLAIKSDANTTSTVVENVTINDADTESNIVTLTNAQEHTGTVTLLGGETDQKFVVNSTLDATTIDAAAQKSDVTLRVGDAVAPITTINQTIKLGAGNDTLIFDTANDLNGSDTITDAGGTKDTVKAFYTADATYAINLADVEKFHTVSTSNATLDLAKATGITEFALLSDEAIDVAGETFAGAVAGVAVTDILTVNNSNLSTLNFFGDVGDAPAADQTTQIFNGVTLANNAANALTVNINSSLDKDGITEATALEGSLNYNLGQLTAHGITAMTIAVADERKETVSGNAAGVATTDIDNIYSKSMSSLTVTARDNVDLGVITGSGTNNSLTKLDASGVGKAFTANVISLGDAAVVTMGNGNNVFSALGSGGKNVSITSGNGNSTVTGTAQADTITTGSGNDTINGDRGDNIIVAGAGDDKVTAKDGNNVLNVGSGLNTVTLNDTTGLDATKATNTVTGTGMTTHLQIDTDGAAGFELDNYLAVGDGAEVSLKFTGGTFDPTASTLNGRTALKGATGAGTEIDTQAEIAALANYSTTNSNLLVFTSNPTAAETFITGSAADVVIDLSAGVGTAYDVQTGAGNDAIVMSNTNNVAHLITAGTGADRVVLSAVAAGVDTLAIADGDSVASGYDIVTNFQAIAATGDILDLGTTIIGANGNLAAVTSTASGALITVGTNIAAGVVTAFGLTDVVGTAGAETTAIVSSAVDANAADTVGVVTLAQTITYLSTALNGTGATVAFAYDYNGTGAVDAGDHTILFQDGASDTVVDLVGLTGVVAVAAANGANTITIA